MDTGSAAAPPEHERAFVAALCAGAEGAFEQLVRGYCPAMLAAARRVLGNDDDAADALQDAMLMVWRSIGSFAAQSQLGTWLHRIAINAALMKLRRRRCRPEQSLDDLLPRFSDDGHHKEPPCPFGPAATVRLFAVENADLVRRAIDALPPSYREIVLLCDLEQLSASATAEMLCITKNAVKIRLHRARQALRTLLQQHFGDAAS